MTCPPVVGAIAWLIVDLTERRRFIKPRPRVLPATSRSALLIGAAYLACGALAAALIWQYERVLADVVSRTNFDLLHVSHYPVSAGRISLALFFAETNGNQNIGNARSNKYKGSFQTGPSEDANGRNKWAAIKPKIAAFDPELIARDAKEEARLGNLDPRYNHWINVRDGLMNAHAELFAQIPAIARTLPNPIDQMKFFELIQIVPSPTRSALASGNLLGYRVSDARIMGYLRNNSMFAYGAADRAKTSANYREIMDAMWLFNEKFERALAEYEKVRPQR